MGDGLRLDIVSPKEMKFLHLVGDKNLMVVDNRVVIKSLLKSTGFRNLLKLSDFKKILENFPLLKRQSGKS